MKKFELPPITKELIIKLVDGRKIRAKFLMGDFGDEPFGFVEVGKDNRFQPQIVAEWDFIKEKTKQELKLIQDLTDVKKYCKRFDICQEDCIFYYEHDTCVLKDFPIDWNLNEERCYNE